MTDNFEIIWRLALIVILAPLVLSAWRVFFIGGPWAPSRKKDFPRILKILDPKKNDLIYELGCGDGRFCLALAKNHNDIKIIGFEFSVLPYLIAKIRVWLAGFNNKVKIKYRNFYSQNLSNADVIFCYLTPWGLRKLKPKLEQELRPGTKVISYAYTIEGWQPDLKDRPSEKDVPIYLYIKK